MLSCMSHIVNHSLLLAHPLLHCMTCSFCCVSCGIFKVQQCDAVSLLSFSNVITMQDKSGVNSLLGFTTRELLHV